MHFFIFFAMYSLQAKEQGHDRGETFLKIAGYIRRDQIGH